MTNFYLNKTVEYETSLSFIVFSGCTGCTIGSVTFLRNDTKYYEGVVAKNSSSHCVTRYRIYAYQISSPHQFLISHKLLFCWQVSINEILL